MQKGLKFFTIFAGITFCVIAGLIVFAFRFHETNQLEVNAAERSMAISQGISAAIANEYRKLTELVPRISGDALRRRPEITEMRKAIGRATDGVPVLRVRVLDGKGLVLFATDPNRIGESIQPTTTIDPTLNNIRLIEKVADLKGELRDRYVYTSKRAIASGRIELSFDVTANVVGLDQESRTLAAALSVVLFFLFVALYGFARHANRLFNQSRIGAEGAAYLSDSNARLKAELDTRTSTLAGLEESARRYEAIFENAPIMLHSINPDGKLLGVSDFWLSTLGYERADVIGRPIIDFIADESHTAIKSELIPQLFEMGYIPDRIHKFRKQDGELIDVLIRANPEVDEQGQITRSISVGIELSEALAAEGAIRDSEKRFENLIENSGVAMAVAGTDNRFQIANAAFREYFGYSAEDLKDLDATTLLGNEDIALSREEESDGTERTRDIYTVERRYAHKDGSVRWGITSIFYQRDSGGRIERTVSQIQDITQSRRAQSALRESEERFRGMFENSAIGMNISTPGGRYILVNDAFSKFIGYPPEELYGFRVEDITHPDEVEMMREQREELGTGTTGHISRERRYIHKSGEVIWGISTLTMVRDSAGKPSHLIGQIQDITEHKRQEEELRQQGNRLDLTLETAVVGTWGHSYRDGRHSWDERTQRIFGVDSSSGDTGFESNFWAGVHPEDLAEVRRAITTAEDAASDYEGEFRVVRPDGDVRYVRARGTVMRDYYERAVQMVVACMDVTEIKRAEALLRENQERLARLHEITSDYARSHEDKVGRLLELGCETFGVPVGLVTRIDDETGIVDQAFGVSSAVLDPGWTFPRRGDHYPIGISLSEESYAAEAAVSYQQDIDREQKSFLFDGTLEAGSYLGTPLVVDYQRYGVLSFVDPSTGAESFSESDRAFVQLMAQWIGGEISRDRAGQALRESQERFRDIAESASDWFWEIDADSQYTYISDRGLELIGAGTEDILGKDRLDVAMEREIDADPDEMESHVELVSRSRPFTDFEYSLETTQGERLYVQESGKPHFDKEGVFRGYRGVTRDVTSRWLAQEEIVRAKEEAELANQAKSRFLASASHDLRQPLQALNLFVSSLVDLENDPEKRTILDKTQMSLDALASLLNALLDISRLDAGSIVPEKVNFSFHHLARLAQEFAPVAASQGLSLKVVPSSVALYSDPVLLETIVRNLLGNALKYTDRGRVLMGCRRLKESIRIEVWDTGQGIAPDQMELIFEEFYQIGNEARDREKGLGLGLSIVNRTAHLLGHQVSARSEFGRGSVFTVEVPLAKGKVEAVGRSTPLPVNEVSGRIVLIDDEPQILDSMKILLGNMGFDVHACRVTGPACPDFERIPEHYDHQPPDLIVSDYRLPDGMTGIDAVERLRAEFSSDIPAILLSGDISEESLRHVQEHHFSMLHKPVHSDDLRAAIFEMLQSSGA